MSTVYQVITDRIIERLEAGTIPWRKPWTTRGLDGMPRNLVTRRPYRGVNVWLLSIMGYASPDWLTYRQAATLGGHVRRGEKATPVIFWKWPDAPAAEPDTDPAEPATTRPDRPAPILRYFSVFNVEQCDGLPTRPAAAPAPAPDPIDAAERLVAGMPNRPEVRHAGGAAFYRPSIDVVTLPPRDAFTSGPEYYSTLFHELTHSTGHPSRLNRLGVAEVAPFGSPVYSREELVAEMGAAFLCAVAGIEPATLDNSAAYLGSWLARLREDSRLVVIAAAQAQRAADYILDASKDCRERRLLIAEIDHRLGLARPARHGSNAGQEA